MSTSFSSSYQISRSALADCHQHHYRARLCTCCGKFCGCYGLQTPAWWWKEKRVCVRHWVKRCTLAWSLSVKPIEFIHLITASIHSSLWSVLLLSSMLCLLFISWPQINHTSIKSLRNITHIDHSICGKLQLISPSVLCVVKMSSMTVTSTTTLLPHLIVIIELFVSTNLRQSISITLFKSFLALCFCQSVRLSLVFLQSWQFEKLVSNDNFVAN